MHFFAVLDEGSSQQSFKRVSVNAELQVALVDFFRRQREEFLDNLEEVDFDPRYKADEDEIFVIGQFELPAELVDVARHPGHADALSLAGEPKIKSIVATEYNPTSRLMQVYFQAFSRQRLLVQSWTILQSRDTFTRMRDPGLTLDSKLAAFFSNGNLYFKKFATVSRFLDLTPHFIEASDQDITVVLGHSIFSVQDQDAVINLADSVMRKRFMAVKASGVLDTVTAHAAKTQASKYGLNVLIRNRRIVFPTEKKSAKELLRFLMEGYYEGPLTGTKFVTNSQRPLET